MSANVSRKKQRVEMHGSGLPMPRDLGVGEHPASGVLSSMKSLSQTRRSLLSGWRAFALLRKSRSRSSLSSSKRWSWRAAGAEQHGHAAKWFRRGEDTEGGVFEEHIS